MEHLTPRHTEFEPMALWVRALTWSAVGAGVWGLTVNPPSDGPVGSALIAAVLSLGILVELVFGGVKIELFSDKIRVSLGRVGWIRKVVPFDTIARVEPVQYRPIKEFGGWGVRGFGKKQAWTARGNRALVLHRTDGSQLYLGHSHPERLAERVRSISRRPLA